MEEILRQRLKVTQYPTALQELSNIRKYYDIKPRLFIKRDDTTSVGLGGNKNRKLDYLLYDALEKQSTLILTTGSVESNHCRQTVAYCNFLGLNNKIVLVNNKSLYNNPNLFLMKLYSSNITYCSSKYESKILLENLSEKSERDGYVPYIIPLGGSNVVGCLGYINFMKELSQQVDTSQRGVIFLAVGSGGTLSGMVLGQQFYITNLDICGISISKNKQEQYEKVEKLTEDFLKTNISTNAFKPKYNILDDYLFGGYGCLDKKVFQTIKIVAALEGIILDPIYTGKAFLGMIEELTSGKYDNKDYVIFLHTGGSPTILNYKHFKYYLDY